MGCNNRSLPQTKQNPQCQKAKTLPSKTLPLQATHIEPCTLSITHIHTYVGRYTYAATSVFAFQGHYIIEAIPLPHGYSSIYLHCNISSTLYVVGHMRYKLYKSYKNHNIIMRYLLAFCTKLWHSNIKSGSMIMQLFGLMLVD